MNKKMFNKLQLLLLTTLALGLFACVGMPDNVQAVTDFDLNRYLGKWYEIARLDHSFERHLSQVTAEYALQDDGSVQVLNQGYHTQRKSWEKAQGKALFVGSSDQAYLKVSFFGPFYGSYIVFDLDKENYQYAAVSGPTYSYLWILSRTPTLDEATKQRLIGQAQLRGFDTSALIFVDQG